MTIDFEMIKAKLSDAYIKGLAWEDIAAQYPQVNAEFFKEITAEIEMSLKNSQTQLRPKEYYCGIGIEADEHENGLLLTQVYKACPAEDLDARVGDVVLKVNFQSISEMDLHDALKALRNSSYQDGVILEVMRNGEIVTLGYGVNAQPKFIDARRKYPLNFTALTIGKRLKLMQSEVNMALDGKNLVKNKDFAMSL